MQKHILYLGRCEDFTVGSAPREMSQAISLGALARSGQIPSLKIAGQWRLINEHNNLSGHSGSPKNRT